MNAKARFVPGATRAPRNQWYVVAYSHEVQRSLLGREILGDRLVLFRTEGGEAVALEDRCAHRGVALSKGKLLGDVVQCPYHGVTYGPSGNCTHIPSQSSIPSQMCVRSYPLREKGPLIWAWLGSPANVDPGLIPDYSGFGMADPSFVTDPLMLTEMNGNYQLLHENLLDVSHISVLHEGTMDSGGVVLVDPKVAVNGNHIRIERELEETMTGGSAQFFQYAEGTRVLRRLSTDNWAPNLCVVTNHFTEVEHPHNPPRIAHYVFPITPQTMTSSWMFPTASKNFGGHVPEPVIQMMHAINTQDMTAIESIQESYDQLGADTPDVSVRADEAALRYRRIIAELLAQDDALSSGQGVARTIALTPA